MILQETASNLLIYLVYFIFSGIETWIGWDSFLVDCIKGYSKKVIRSMNGDEILKQYQIKVALYIAAHYGHLDLAHRMLSMGAKADQPVGDHPNRQWQVVTELKPEYMRCAIHEAVKSGQVKIVNLFINDKFWLLEHRDGYGLSTWRLSLHNSHTDPARRLNQKDVAIYLLMKQRRSRIQLTGNLHVSCAFYCNLKKWIDTAREIVFFLHGPTKSSYKKAPFNRGGLLGYKVLVDGYNHNFKEYQNAYDEMRAKYKHYYYLDDAEKQICDPVAYFRHLNAKLMVNSAATTFKPAHQSQNPRKSALKQFPTKRNIKWKKLINKIIMQNILKRYEHVLLKFGYDVVSKINKLNKKSNKPRINFSNCSTSVHKEGSIADQQMPHADTHDIHNHNVGLNASKANQVPKRKVLGLRTQLDAARSVANAKPLNKSFSAIETKRPSYLRSVSRNMSSMKIGTSMSANEIILSTRELLTPDENFILNENRKSKSALASRSKLIDAKNCFHDGQNILFNSKHIDKNLVDSTIRPFSKCFADQTPKIIAKKYYVTAKEFKNKSWLQQLYISIRMASNDVQRRLQET